MFALTLVILLGITFIVLGLIGLLDSRQPVRRTKAGIGAGVALLLAVIVFIVASIAIIPVGHVGVMVRFQKTTGKILENGLNWKSMLETPIKMNIQTQKYEVGCEAASKDLQDVQTTIAVNYKLDGKQAAEVYRTIGHDYLDVICKPAIQEVVKAITARYNAEDMITKRENVRIDIAAALEERLAQRGIISEFVNITNFQFSDEFTKAIESKVVAVQRVMEAENKLKQIEVEARQAEAEAKGFAAAAIARAEGQAEANRIVNESLTDSVLQYYFIDKLGENVEVWVVPQGQPFTILPQK